MQVSATTASFCTRNFQTQPTNQNAQVWSRVSVH